MKRIDLECPHCGEREARADASAAWNVERQAWELVTVYDNRDCNACGASGIWLVEVEIEPE